jgi:hypothetical protein
MKAVIIKEAGKAEVTDITEQSMRPDYFKIKSVAVAVNPSRSLVNLLLRRTNFSEPISTIVLAQVV